MPETAPDTTTKTIPFAAFHLQRIDGHAFTSECEADGRLPLCVAVSTSEGDPDKPDEVTVYFAGGTLTQAQEAALEVVVEAHRAPRAPVYDPHAAAGPEFAERPAPDAPTPMLGVPALSPLRAAYVALVVGLALAVSQLL